MQLLKFDIPGVLGGLTTRTWALQRSYNWQLMMPFTIEGVLGVFVSQYCQDVKFGDYSVSELTSVRYGAFQRFYAGIDQIDTVSLQFIMPVDNSVYDFFRFWRELVRSPEGHYRVKREYAKNIYVMTYDRSGIQSGQYLCHGCFPKTIPPITLSYGEDSVLKWGLDLSVDYIETFSLIGSIEQSVVKAIGSIPGVAKLGQGVQGLLGG